MPAMIPTSFVIFLYVVALLFQVVAVIFSIKLYRQAAIYRLPCLLFVIGFLLMVTRRIYPILDVLDGKSHNVLDAVTAFTISGLLMLGTYFIARAFSSIEAQSMIYEVHSKVDAMTGAMRRDETFIRLEREVGRAFRNKQPLALIMLDIDFFKFVNDRYGHMIGDLVLKNLAHYCQKMLRDIDLFGRVGGEEFLVILPNTNQLQALEVAERLRVGVEQAVIADDNGDPVKITISNGISLLNPDAELDLVHSALAEKYFKEADMAMYQAKLAGRNRSVVWEDS